MAVRDVTELLTDSSFTWRQRLTRLQGWRGDDARRADATALAQRVGPAGCAAGAALGAVLQSPPVLALFALTALIGAVAPNHPFESAYNAWARRRGGDQLPANRAAKRLGCAIGAVLLGAAALGYATGESTTGLVLALVLAGTAAFVATTGICLPSMLYTALLGPERAAAPSLVRR